VTKQEERREGIAKICQECEFPYWSWETLDLDVREDYLNQADKILSYLHSQGVVIRVDRELPDSAYDSLIFPTTIEEAGKFLTDKGLTDREKSAISGTIARLGWENCAKAMDDAGYVAVEPLIKE